MKFTQHMNVCFTVAACVCLSVFITACSYQPVEKCSLNFVLDMSSVLHSRSSVSADGQEYYLKLSAQSYTSSWKYESGVLALGTIPETGTFFTLTIPSVPLGERMTVSLSVYTDASASDTSLIASAVSDPFTTAVTNEVPFTLSTTGEGDITVSTPGNRAVTLSLASDPAASMFTYNDTVTKLTFTASCSGASSGAAYAWYVNGRAVTGFGTGPSVTTTPAAFADSVSSVLNADGSNTVSVTVTENGIITGRASTVIVFTGDASGTGTVAVSLPENKAVTVTCASDPSASSFLFNDTATNLTLSASCQGASSGAVYTWYVNGMAIPEFGTAAMVTTTPAVFANSASAVLNADGANTVSVTVSENGIITGQGTLSLVYRGSLSGL